MAFTRVLVNVDDEIEGVLCNVTGARMDKDEVAD